MEELSEEDVYEKMDEAVEDLNDNYDVPRSRVEKEVEDIFNDHMENASLYMFIPLLARSDCEERLDEIQDEYPERMEQSV
ncbi:MAG: hypothetical protein ABEJ72_03790 [Candidatus Aenigmatarchaeota archaeon]